MKIQQVTPLLFVDSIESVLPFWQEQLGYQELVSVPHGEHKGFILLKRDDSQIMLQTHASLREDLPAIAKLGVASALYVDVASLDAAKQAVPDSQVIVPERTTFYGAREFAVHNAASQVVIFSEHHR